MKTQRKITVLAILMLAANAVMAQSSNTLGANEIQNQKLFVQMKVTPQSNVFKANVAGTDVPLKFKVWIANPEEARYLLVSGQKTGSIISAKDYPMPGTHRSMISAVSKMVFILSR
jgi:hypothetical protein